MKAEVNSFNLGGLKVIIGKHGCIRCAAELESAERRKPLIVSDRGIERCGITGIVQKSLEEAGIAYEMFLDVESDPCETTVEKALKRLREKNCDAVIGIGGGSVMDVAKCVRMLCKNEGRIFDYDNSSAGGKKFQNHGEFLILVPTTAGTGSEASSYAVITNEKEGRKATISSNYIVADVAILDPELTLELPKNITAATGMDALAHAVGAYTSGRVLNAAGDTSFTDMAACLAMQLIADNLIKAYEDGGNYKARKNMQLASFIAAWVACAGSDGCHGLGHALGGIYHVPHGIACALVMPYIMEFNADSCPERMKRIAEIFGEKTEGLDEKAAAKKASEAVRKLSKRLQLPLLKVFVGDFEKKEEVIQAAQEEKCTKLNPRELTREKIKSIFERAYCEK